MTVELWLLWLSIGAIVIGFGSGGLITYLLLKRFYPTAWRHWWYTVSWLPLAGVLYVLVYWAGLKVWG